MSETNFNEKAFIKHLIDNYNLADVCCIMRAYGLDVSSEEITSFFRELMQNNPEIKKKHVNSNDIEKQDYDDSKNCIGKWKWDEDDPDNHRNKLGTVYKELKDKFTYKRSEAADLVDPNHCCKRDLNKE